MPSSKLSSMAPSSSLLLFLVSSSVWVALPLPLPVAPAADGQGGEDCRPVLCGNVNISFPFGLVTDAAADEPAIRCRGLDEFQISCQNNTPYFGSYQSEYSLRIVSIFYHNSSLLVANTYLRRPYFNRSSPVGCQIPTAGDTFNQLAPPFLVSPLNQKLIFYNCTKPPPPPLPGGGLVETVCGNNTFVRAANGRSDESGNYSLELEGCTFAMVPVFGGVPGEVNASNYKQLVWDGYLATWQLPPPPPPASNSIVASTLFEFQNPNG